MSEELRSKILDLVSQYWAEAHQPAPFVPGKSRVNYAGRVYDDRDMTALVGSALDFWLTAGPRANEFEKAMSKYFTARDFLLVNSGSSANLLMVSTLCAPDLARFLRSEDPPVMKDGDEVITPAVTFPTTLAPILQNRLTPVFVDAEIGTYNVDHDELEAAIGPKTRAIFVPHTVGNPCDMDRLVALAEAHDLWLLEDGCDALGATWNGRLVGTFGAMSSLSFYPAHHITMGEGGGVAINRLGLKRTARSMRDWGRDCWCDPGVNDTCGKRFDQQLGDLPCGYDHKYTYSNIGYNLKVTDMQAAIGLVQITRVEEVVARRRHNFWRLYDGLRSLEEHIVLPVVLPQANPSPFGFPITVDPRIDRNALVNHLEQAGIETRLVFGGNILRQPGYLSIPKRVHGSMDRTDRIMRDTFFVGVYPRLTDEMIDYVIDKIHEFFQNPVLRPGTHLAVRPG